MYFHVLREHTCACIRVSDNLTTWDRTRSPLCTNIVRASHTQLIGAKTFRVHSKLLRLAFLGELIGKRSSLADKSFFYTRIIHIRTQIDPSSREARQPKPKRAVPPQQRRWCLSYGILQCINYTNTAALRALGLDLRLITRFAANPPSLFRPTDRLILFVPRTLRRKMLRYCVLSGVSPLYTFPRLCSTSRRNLM